MSQSTFKSIGQAAADLALSLDSSLGSLLRKAQRLLRKPLPAGVARELQRIESKALACRSELKTSVARGRRHAPRSSVLEPEVLLYRALECVERRARMAGVRISLAIEADLPRVVGDPVSLEHAFLLALLCAVQAVKEEGADLTVLADTVWEYGLPQLRVSIADDRSSPPFAPLPDLGVPGRGFGLGVVRDVIVDHGGSFETREGGTTGLLVAITLPGTAAGR